VSGDTHNVFTVDLEEWFHMCAAGEAVAARRWPLLPSRVELTTRLLLDLLDDANVRATFFVVGWVAERHGQLIEDVRGAGHDIGSHGYIHEKAYDLGRERFRADLRRNGRSTIDRSGRLTSSPMKDSKSMRAWRR
jgi:peptidoglycan/xylan/chitin deacetylase (PgdA/CDA1 family)